MNTFLIILFIIIVIILGLALAYVILYNKFNESIIRIQEAEIRIDTNLREKYDLLTKIINLSNNIVPDINKSFGQLFKLKAMRISNFEMDRILVREFNNYSSFYNDKIKLREDDEIYKINKQIELIDFELVTLRDYYNHNIANYNRMVKKIPTNIIAKIKKYEIRNYYDLKDLNDEDIEDFKI